MTNDPVLVDLLAKIDARRAVLAHAAAVLQAIDAEIGACPFICPELRDRAALPHPEALRLRASIIAAIGSMNLRKLGWLFASFEGKDLGGLEVHRMGHERSGEIWKVVAAGLSR